MMEDLQSVSKDYDFRNGASGLLSSIVDDFEINLDDLEAPTSELYNQALSLQEEGNRLEKTKITETDMKQFEKKVRDLRVKITVESNTEELEVLLSPWIKKPRFTRKKLTVNGINVTEIVTMLQSIVNKEKETESLKDILKKLINCRARLDEIIISGINTTIADAEEQIKKADRVEKERKEEETRFHKEKLRENHVDNLIPKEKKKKRSRERR